MSIQNKFRQGISLIEILVVITIFAILGVLVTQSVVLTLIGTKKSESIVHTRENMNYALGIIERQIRNATSATCPNQNTISYVDQNGKTSTFLCINAGGNDSYVASGSAVTRLTSDTVTVTSCVFTCTPATGSKPALVQIDLTMSDASAIGAQGSNVSASTQIYLRNY